VVDVSFSSYKTRFAHSLAIITKHRQIGPLCSRSTRWVRY
jgi:hypothetical protein